MKKIFWLVMAIIVWSISPALAGTIYYNDFSGLPVGLLSEENFTAEWNRPEEVCGLGKRIFIAKEWFNKSLAVSYPKGIVGPVDGGAEWRTYIGEYNEVILSYRVKFEKGFNFVNGGKLPGLCGGRELITGGKKADGANGWSVRLMWNYLGVAKVYVYYPGFNGAWGDAFHLAVDGRQKYFEPGQWYKVKVRVVMNTPGQANGVLQVWLDGDLSVDKKDFVYRTVPGLKVNFFHFSTFFGGNTSEWAPIKDEVVYFDDFLLETP